MSQIQRLGPESGGGVGDVIGPSSSTDGAIALFDGITGKLIKESLNIQQCNRVQTTDATPTNLLVVALDALADGVYEFEVRVPCFNSTDTLGAAYFITGGIRTDGTDSTLIGTPDKGVNEEVGMENADANAVAGGVADNNLYIQVTGIAAKTIEWSGCITHLKAYS